jgi:antitoxin CptB
MDDLETRRRRALYRATHRGTKEMDWLLGRYAEARLSTAEEGEVAELERLMALPDPDLQHWILDGGDIGSTELAPLIGRIRTFHGITNPKDGA